MAAGQGVSNKVVAKAPELKNTPKAITNKPESKSSSNPNARQNLIRTEPKSAAPAVQINHTNVAQPAAAQSQLPFKNQSNSKPLKLNNDGNENNGGVQANNRPPLPEMQPTVLPKAKRGSDKQPSSAVAPVATTNAPVVNQVAVQQAAPGQNADDLKKTAEKILPIVGDLPMHHPNSGRRETTLNQYPEGVAKAVSDIVQVSTDLTAAGLVNNPCVAIAHVDMEAPGQGPKGQNPLQLTGAYNRGYGHLVKTLGSDKVNELFSNWTPYQQELAVGLGYVDYNKNGAFGDYLKAAEKDTQQEGKFFPEVDGGLTIALAAYNGGVGSAERIIRNNNPSTVIQEYAQDVIENAQTLDDALNKSGDETLANLCPAISPPNPNAIPAMQPPTQ
jgi:hypothetical protein